jgi:predicted nucleotidyltransferase
MPPIPNIDRDALAAFCRKWHIRRLWLFGSVLRDDFTEGKSRP